MWFLRAQRPFPEAELNTAGKRSVGYRQRGWGHKQAGDCVGECVICGGSEKSAQLRMHSSWTFDVQIDAFDIRPASKDGVRGCGRRRGFDA
jgi:hypothetical protein